MDPNQNFWKRGTDSNQLTCQKCQKSLEIQNLSEEFVKGAPQSFRMNRNNNQIVTSKYNLINFLPKTLFQNFLRIGNIYFIVISIIMLSAPKLSPYVKQWIVIVPLFIFTFIFMIKEFIVDQKRKKYDFMINHQKALRGKIGSKSEQDCIEEVLWQDLAVGDIVKVEMNQMVPADIILLDSNQADGKDNICYLDMYLVEGLKEKMLKKSCQLTRVPPKSHAKFNFKNYQRKLSMKLDYTLPSNDTHDFNGHLKLNKDPKREILSIDNFIPRGAINMSGWIYGLVVYAGNDTKIMLNSIYPRQKDSFLDIITKKIFYLTFFFITLFSCISIIIIMANQKNIKYISEIDPSVVFSDRIFTYFILYSQLIPVSIYGYIDLINLFQMYKLTLTRDIQGHKLKPGQITINDPKILSSLGHIDYLVMDNCLSTGKYEITNIIVYQQLYDINPASIQQQLKQQQYKLKKLDAVDAFAINDEQMPVMQSTKQKDKNNFSSYNYSVAEENVQQLVTFRSPSVTKVKLNNFSQQQEQDGQGQTLTVPQITDHQENDEIEDKYTIKQIQDLESYMEFGRQQTICLSNHKQICFKSQINDRQRDSQIFIDHLEQIKINRQENQPKNRESQEYHLNRFLKAVMICQQAKMIYTEKDIEYISKTREEQTNVQFAHLCDYKFLPVVEDGQIFYSCEVQGVKKKYKITLINSYTTVRQRISILIESKNKFTLICRADLITMVDEKMINIDTQETEQIKHITEKFNESGIRGLVYASRVITSKEKDEFLKNYNTLKNSPMVSNEQLDQLARKYETNLNLLGIIAIKDQLVRDARQFVQFLQDSNIHLFLLNGDGEMSTINNLNNLQLTQKDAFKITETNKTDIDNKLKQILSDIRDKLNPNRDKDEKKIIQKVHKENAQKNDFIDSQVQLNKKDEQIAIQMEIPVGPDKQQAPFPSQIIISDEKRIMGYQDMSLGYSPTKDNKNLNEKSSESPIKKIFYKEINTTVKNDGNHLIFDMANSFKWTLILSGQSFKIIQDDPDLYNHFCFIAAFSQHIVGYSMSSQQKQSIVKIIKHKFMNEPTVCAVGDGFHDSLMMQSSHCSFEMKLNTEEGDNTSKTYRNAVSNEENIVSNSGDIMVTSLKDIQNMIQIEGVLTFQRMQNTVFLLYYQGILFGIPLFLFNWHCSFTGTSVFDESWIFFFTFILNITHFFVYGLYDKPLDIEVIKIIPSLYTVGQQDKFKITKNYVLKAGLESILQSFFIYYFVVYIVNRTILHDGKTLDFSSIQMMIQIIIYLVFNIKIIFSLLSRKVWQVLISSAIITIWVLIFIYSYSSDQTVQWNNVVAGYLTWNDGETMITIVQMVIICLFITYTVRKCIYEVYYPNEYEYWQQNLNSILKKNLDSNHIIDNATIIKRSFSKKQNLGQLVKKIFVNATRIDQSINEIINSTNQTNSIMKTNPYTLAFLDQRVESIYFHETARRSRILFYEIYIIALSIFIIYTFVDQYGTGIMQGGISQSVFFIRIGIMAFLLVFFIYIITSTVFIQNQKVMIASTIAFVVSFKILLDWLSDVYTIALTTVICSIITTFDLNIGFLANILMTLANSLNYIIRTLVKTSVKQDQITFYMSASMIILQVFIALDSLYLTYTLEKQKRDDFVAEQEINNQKKINQQMMNLLVPEFVRKRYEKNQITMAKKEPDVVILFCYIDGFNEICAKEDTKILQLLDDLFREYDILAEQYGALKIETVNNTYLCAKGVTDVDQNLPYELTTDKEYKLVLMGMDMIKIVKKYKYDNNSKSIKLKIGIHKGDAIAAVIGFHKPQFSLIGATVNGSQRHCSRGKANCVNLSQEVYMHLVNQNRSDINSKLMLSQWKKEFKTNEEMKGAGDRFVYNNQMITNKNKMRQVLQDKGISIPNPYNSNLADKIRQGMETFIAEQKNDGGQEQVVLEEKHQELDDDSEDEHLHSINLEEAEKTQHLKVNPYFLTCYNNNKEIHDTYKNNLKNHGERESKIIVFLLIIVFLIITLFSISISNILEYDAIYAIRAIFLVLLCIFLICIPYSYNNERIKYMGLVIFLYGTFPSLFQGYVSPLADLRYVQLVEQSLIFITFSNLNMFQFLDLIIFIFFQNIFFFVFYGIVNTLDQVTSNYIQNYQKVIFWVILNVFIIVKNFIKVKENQINFNNFQDRKIKQKNLDILVSNLLPRHIIKKWNSGERLVDKFEMVSLLQADISGFTNFSQTHSLEQTVDVVKDLFENFDIECYRFKLYKLYTVGDQYSIISFLDGDRRKPSDYGQELKNMVNMAFSMVRIIEEKSKKLVKTGEIHKMSDITMRIGIHTGTIIGGVLGTDIVRYDIYGQDLIICGKMESEGKPNEIQLSETSKQMLEQFDTRGIYKYEKREKKIPISAISKDFEVQTYILSKNT